jgi:hypothetical protein
VEEAKLSNKKCLLSEIVPPGNAVSEWPQDYSAMPVA